MGNISSRQNHKRKTSLQQKIGDKRWRSTDTVLSTDSFASRYSYRSYQSQNYSRTWSRTSGRRNSMRTTNDGRQVSVPVDPSKTLYPVSMLEGMFLPDFPIKTETNESHFKIVDMIARGAFGKVMKVKRRDENDDRFYAMKILRKTTVIKENAVQQCKDEVAIQSVCGCHQFIVGCDFFWQSKRELFIVMDYYPNGELLALWKKYDWLPETVVRIYMAELAIVLNFLHNSRVIFRDLKMENILLDHEGHIKLIDFGLAKWLQVGARARTVCGTIQYMAPEILDMQLYTHAVDWWSLGIIMYSLLVGHYPIDGVYDHNQMADEVNKCSYQLPKRFSPDCSAIVSKLLCKDPLKRLQKLNQLQWDPFFSSLDFELIQEKQISPNQIIDRWLMTSSTNKITTCIEEKSDDFDGFDQTANWDCVRQSTDEN